ncbi:CDP-archaeol synthase, partial [Desulfobacterales bacterium HSG17]|nr:CDP-archaeol synthase [Desulfobacterales bacterium HSG17]
LSYFFEEKWDTPLDRGLLFIDGKPFLGNHKTIRGIGGGIIGGVTCGFFLGISLWVALWVGVMSMSGDLLSSFIKRRMRMVDGGNFPVIDQFFEGTFPFIIIAPAYSLSFVQSSLIIVAFIITAYLGALFLTRVLRTEPFAGYTRKLRSKIRFREWRACDSIEYPFHPIINIERTLYYHWFMKTVFKLAGLYERGKQNALDLKLRRLELKFDTLPARFDNTTILFISDLHLDCMDGLALKAQDLVKNLKPDLCIMGGDYRTASWGSYSTALFHLKNLLDHIQTKHGTYAVLGNHDCLEMVSPLKEKGVTFLVNDIRCIENNGDQIWIAGVDDPYYFEGYDLAETFAPIPDNSFTIFIAHTPAIYQEAANYFPQLYLCGHTHAGQVHLPYLGPVITHC